MKVIILEDENRAVNHLKRLIHQVAPEMELMGVFDTVRDAISYLEKKPVLDLIFSDVQLADGLSFEVFSKVKVICPIIFTTAYDTYAIEAFNTNGIDYLLKPIEEERLSKAIEKIRLFNTRIDIESLLNLKISTDRKQPKSRFMVKVGEKIRTIMVEEILAFYSFEKTTYLHTTTHRNYIIDYSLDELEGMLDRERFFKINRKYLVSIDACSQIIAWSNNRLKIDIEGIDDPKIVVARERVRDFKAWLDS
ncbi:MAG: response regulator transcription factor [Bacteroidia bacterium]|nr:MAG: response regulator transcription factor [Bacteroidia bacterium]